jgi:hypothetical protein
MKFFKSEYDKMYFYDKLETYVINFFGCVLYFLLLILFIVLIYGAVYYPEKFKELY